MGEIDARIESVAASAGEEEPPAARTARRKTLCPLAVHLVQRSALACLHVEQPEVGLGMPDGEIAPLGHDEKDMAAVGRGSRPGDGRDAVGACPDERVDSSGIVARSLVEGHAAEAVAFFLIVSGIDLPASGDEVEPTAVGREGRTVFCPEVTHGERVAQDAACLDIVDKDIAGGIINLDALLSIGQVEHL